MSYPAGMSIVAPGATLPELRVSGDHAEVGAAIGRAMRAPIQAAAHAAIGRLDAQGVTEASLRERLAPSIDAAERWVPHLVTELRARAAAAEVPFGLLSYLSSDALPPHVGGCTSVAARSSGGGVVVGHTEDALIPRPEELFLLDADVAGARFLGLCYAHALPGCSAAVTFSRMAVLCDWLPDPDAKAGVPFDFVTRELLAQPSIDAALDVLDRIPRGGSGNLLLAQGERIVNVELSSTRMAVVHASATDALAHTNHFLDPSLAAAAGEPQANSPPRLARAREIARSGLDLKGMRSLLSDRAHSPDSICRALTIGAFAADLRTGDVEVCWGEPDRAIWTRHRLDQPSA
jgi:isopenicillin-N N-acyltransferase like protein